MSSSGLDPRGRKEEPQPLKISKDSPNINNPPPPPTPIIIREELPQRIINVKTPADFKYIIQLLTGSPDHPPPTLPSDDNRPAGVLSPTPTSLPPVSQNAFTDPPPDPPLDNAFLMSPPSSEQRRLLSVYDYQWDEPEIRIPVPPPPTADNFHTFNFRNLPPPSTYYNNLPPPPPNFRIPPPPSNFRIPPPPSPSPGLNIGPSSSNSTPPGTFKVPPPPLHFRPKFPDPKS